MKKGKYNFEDFRYKLIALDLLYKNDSLDDENFTHTGKSLITVHMDSKHVIRIQALSQYKKSATKGIFFCDRVNLDKGILLVREFTEKEAKKMFTDTSDRWIGYSKTAYFHFKKELLDAYQFGPDSLFYDKDDIYRSDDKYKNIYSKPDMLIIEPKENFFPDPYEEPFLGCVDDALSLFGLQAYPYDINFKSIISSFNGRPDKNFIFLYTEPLDGSELDYSICIPELALSFLSLLGQNKLVEYRMEEINNFIGELDQNTNQSLITFSEYQKMYENLISRTSEIKKLKYVLHNEIKSLDELDEKYEKQIGSLKDYTHTNVVEKLKEQRYLPLRQSFDDLLGRTKNHLNELKNKMSLLDMKNNDYRDFSSENFNMLSIKANLKLQRIVLFLTYVTVIIAIISLIIAIISLIPLTQK